LSLQQTQDEGPPDALAVQVTLVNPQVVEQGDVVGRVGVPAVLCGNGRVGLATRVALIHRDHPEVRGEFGDGVHGSGGTVPDGDSRLQASGREHEDGKALAEFLVINGSAVVCKAWHVVSFRHRDR